MGVALLSICAEAPEPALVTCTNASRSTPVARASSSASASAAALAAPRALLMSLSISPWPSSPTCTISLPMASRSGFARAKSSALPPAMIVRVPSSARGEEPVTGASSMLTARSPSAAPIRRVSAGEMVEQSTHRSPERAAWMTPRSPSRISETCSPSTTMLTTMSLASATSAGVAHAEASCSDAQRSALPGVCVQTASGKPARTTLAAMREPMMPRPRKQIRSGIPESSPTGGFDAQPLARPQCAGGLARQAVAVELIAPPRSRLAAEGPGGGVAATLGDQREAHLRQRLQLADDAIAAAVHARAAGAAAQRVLDHAQREFPLERLDRSVERVAHRHVNAARAIRAGARALAASEGLVVGEARVAEREVVHRALAERAAEGCEDQVGDAGGGLDVSASHGRAGARVQQAALRGAHLHRAVGAGRGRDIRVGEDAHGEQAGRAGDRERAVEIAVMLGRAAGEVERQLLAREGRVQAQLDVPSGRLQYVLGVNCPVRHRQQARTGAAPSGRRAARRRRASRGGRSARVRWGASGARSSPRRPAGWRMPATSCS